MLYVIKMTNILTADSPQINYRPDIDNSRYTSKLIEL